MGQLDLLCCFCLLLLKSTSLISTKRVLLLSFDILSFWCFCLGISILSVLHQHSMLCGLSLFFQQFVYSLYYLHTKWSPDNSNFKHFQRQNYQFLGDVSRIN
jgi:hypothetical protein